MDRDYVANLFNLAGKTAAITGGGGVLCGEIAQALARVGVNVVVLDILPDKAQEVVGQIKRSGAKAVAVPCNVLERASIEQARAAAHDAFGPIDILINGAGGNKREATTSDQLAFFDLPADAIRWVFELNILGTVLPSQVFGQDLAQKGQGSILNISSMSAFRPLTRVPAYSAAKAAVSNFTAWLAVHMAQTYSKNIRVNAIAPGFFLTEQNRFLLTDEKTGQLTARGRQIIDHTPMGRFGQPADLIGTVLWLLSPAAAFVHGAVIPIDGGFAAYSGV